MDQMDWFKSEEKKFDDIPEGLYTAKLTNATLDETKDEPRFSIEFTLPSNRRAWMNLRMNEKQRKFMNWQMSELGVFDLAKEKATAGMPVAHAFLDALGTKIGKSYDIEITYRDWQGKKFMSVRVDGPAILGRVLNPEQRMTPKAVATEAPSFDAGEEMPF